MSENQIDIRQPSDLQGFSEILLDYGQSGGIAWLKRLSDGNWQDQDTAEIFDDYEIVAETDVATIIEAQ